MFIGQLWDQDVVEIISDDEGPNVPPMVDAAKTDEMIQALLDLKTSLCPQYPNAFFWFLFMDMDLSL